MISAQTFTKHKNYLNSLRKILYIRAFGEFNVLCDIKSNIARISLEAGTREIGQLDLPSKLIEFDECGSQHQVQRQLVTEYS